jgi:hypothetical protein
MTKKINKTQPEKDTHVDMSVDPQTIKISSTNVHVVETNQNLIQNQKIFDGFPANIDGHWVPGSGVNTDMI